MDETKELKKRKEKREEYMYAPELIIHIPPEEFKEDRLKEELMKRPLDESSIFLYPEESKKDKLKDKLMRKDIDETDHVIDVEKAYQEQLKKKKKK